MTIKTSDIEIALNLLEKINTYAFEQQLEQVDKSKQDFYGDMHADSFELWAALKKELRLRAM